MQCDIEAPRVEFEAPVHPDEGELLVVVEAPGEAMEDAPLVEALQPAAILPLYSYQPFKTIIFVLARKIAHLMMKYSPKHR